MSNDQQPTCPECGSECTYLGDSVRHYECGVIEFFHGGLLHQSDQCKINVLQAQLKESEQRCNAANACLAMVKDVCEQLGEDMSGTPAMFYEEAIMCIAVKKNVQLKAKDAEIAELRASYALLKFAATKDPQKIRNMIDSYKTRIDEKGA